MVTTLSKTTQEKFRSKPNIMMYPWVCTQSLLSLPPPSRGSLLEPEEDHHDWFSDTPVCSGRFWSLVPELSTPLRLCYQTPGIQPGEFLVWQALKVRGRDIWYRRHQPKPNIFMSPNNPKHETWKFRNSCHSKFT